MNKSIANQMKILSDGLKAQSVRNVQGYGSAKMNPLLSTPNKKPINSKQVTPINSKQVTPNEDKSALKGDSYKKSSLGLSAHQTSSPQFNLANKVVDKVNNDRNNINKQKAKLNTMSTINLKPTIENKNEDKEEEKSLENGSESLP